MISGHPSVNDGALFILGTRTGHRAVLSSKGGGCTAGAAEEQGLSSGGCGRREGAIVVRQDLW